MLDFAQFKEEFITGCRNALYSDTGKYAVRVPGFGQFMGVDSVSFIDDDTGMGSDMASTGKCNYPVPEIEIIESSVYKPQTGRLTGLCFKKPDALGGPTIYAEDYYKLYKKGYPISKLSSEAIRIIRPFIDDLPQIPQTAFMVSEDPEHLSLRLLSKSRNRETLRRLPYFDLGCGLVLIADMNYGDLRAVVTNEMIGALDITQEELFRMIFQNLSIADASFSRLENLMADDYIMKNGLLDSPPGTVLSETDTLYLLTNRDNYWGSAALFYPGVMAKIHELMDGDFYVLPSSVHELLILPVLGHDPEGLVYTIQSANRVALSEGDILSDDLYVCDSEALHRVSYGGFIPARGSMLC